MRSTTARPSGVPEGDAEVQKAAVFQKWEKTYDDSARTVDIALYKNG
jgi:hypothetical protein